MVQIGSRYLLQPMAEHRTRSLGYARSIQRRSENSADQTVDNRADEGNCDTILTPTV